MNQHINLKIKIDQIDNGYLVMFKNQHKIGFLKLYAKDYDEIKTIIDKYLTEAGIK